MSLSSTIESKRIIANQQLEHEKKSAFGQYMTPESVASFMASLFPEPTSKQIKLLDPGAGIGSLTSAFVERFSATESPLLIASTSYEIDSIMQLYLRENLSLCKSTARQNRNVFTWQLREKDFIVDASGMLASAESFWQENTDRFTHCIMNPPYKKIASSSKHRTLLRSAGIETVNLYSAFVALSILLLEPNGYLVAIIPRSFCNGPYYKPFRKLLLENTSIERIHLFGSRSKAFKDDRVLQENIIIALKKNGEQSNVAISTSTDDTFSDLTIYDCSFSDVVKKTDNDNFIHIPSSPDNSCNLASNFSFSISDVGVNISTGPVVDFRVREHLRKMPKADTTPILYPCHFKNNTLVWPIPDGKKPNAIAVNSDTQKQLYPNGFYAVVRRFSSKEEKRRIVAGVVEPDKLGNTESIGLENHLNVFHDRKKPLDENLARGIATYLNSTIVDECFRSFSGHTQVNATDLKLMKYPSRDILQKLGKWASLQRVLTQEIIDNKIESISK
jgi:adenine-specific DNA-methyltransferase